MVVAGTTPFSQGAERLSRARRDLLDGEGGTDTVDYGARTSDPDRST